MTVTFENCVCLVIISILCYFVLRFVIESYINSTQDFVVTGPADDGKSFRCGEQEVKRDKSKEKSAVLDAMFIQSPSGNYKIISWMEKSSYNFIKKYFARLYTDKGTLNILSESMSEIVQHCWLESVLGDYFIFVTKNQGMGNVHIVSMETLKINVCNTPNKYGDVIDMKLSPNKSHIAFVVSDLAHIDVHICQLLGGDGGMTLKPYRCISDKGIDSLTWKGETLIETEAKSIWFGDSDRYALEMTTVEKNTAKKSDGYSMDIDVRAIYDVLQDKFTNIKVLA